MPKVSILLTCYNHLEYLQEALDGVTSQTFTDWEIIAIDDGSKDGTREWLSASSVPMTRIFNEKNLGSYGSLNKALAAATGDYIAVLNDDDVWLPRKLELQVEAMESSTRVGLVHTFGKFIDGQSSPVLDPKPLGFTFPRTGNGDVLASLVHYNKVINSSALVRREAFEKVGDWDAAFYGCGDWHLWLRIAREYEVRYIDEELTLYRVHETNACRDEDKMNDDSRRIREWIATWDASEFASRPDVVDALAVNMASLGTERMWKGDRQGARRAYLGSIKIRPS
ncbi:MAG: glycosyltransferase, partial [Armatimonadota bacterium]